MLTMLTRSGPDQTIHDAAADAVHMAVARHESVTFRFNGIVVHVSPLDTVEKVVERYRKLQSQENA